MATRMALRLRVVSEQRRSLGERGTVVFGVGGGTIGRARDNDWVLPDPARYVSSRHARVQFQQGRYLLQDLSTNGVYVNDGEQPLGKTRDHELQDGDRVRLGPYELLATVDAATDFPPDRSAIVAMDGLGGTHADLAATEGDIGASLSVEGLLSRDAGISDSFRAVNAYGQPVANAHAPARDPDIDRHANAVSQRIAKLTRAVRAREAASPAALYDVQTGLATFCRGAGIDADKLPRDAATRMLHLAGQLLRETALGLKDVERARRVQRNRFRIEETVDTIAAPLSLAASSVDDLVIALLGSHDSRRLDAVQWLRQRIADSVDHDEAVLRAMRAAFVEFVDRLEPLELEGRFERALKRGKLTGAARSQYWELYSEFYRNVTEMPADHLPHVFVEAFAKAYRATVAAGDEVEGG